MKNFKAIIFTAAPFIIFSIFNSLTAPFWKDDPSFIRSVTLICTFLSIALAALQFVLKDRHFFPGTITLFFIITCAVVFSIPMDNYSNIVAGSNFLTLFLSKPQIGLYSMMFLMAVLPPILGFDTFTYYFAKRTTPEAFHASRLFRVVNLYITAFWALLFLLSIAAQFLPGLVLQIAVPMGLQFVIGAPATVFLIPYLQGRLAHVEKGVVRNYLKTAYDAVTGMTFIMNKKAATELDLVIQFIITGDENFTGYLHIKDGSCVYVDGINNNANLTITSPADIWLKISRGEIPGNEAFLKKMYTVEGDLENLIKLQDLFENPKAVKYAKNKQSSNMKSSVKYYKKLKPNSVKKVLAINGSPRAKGVSKTEIVMNAFLEGCRTAGAETEVVNLREKVIHHCTGCYSCWTANPGRCVIKDDARDIIEKVSNADLVVYAFPLYHFGINSLLKKFIERTLVILQPYLIRGDDGSTSHPLREEFNKPVNAVIIGVCGFPEVSHFGAASANFHYIADSGGEHFNIIAELYRPASEGLGVPFYKNETDRVLKLYRTAGEQSVTKGEVDIEIADAIAEIGFDIEKFRNEANMTWDLCIKEKKTLPQIQSEFFIIPSEK